MAKDELIDDRVSLNQCQKAVDALHAYVSEVAAKKAETQLLPDVEQAFWLTIALKKQPQGSSLKVYSIPIAHPIVDPRKESVCLFTKDPQRTYKDLLADNNIRFISKVIDISKLKGKYKAFDARRALLKEHGLFLADDRVIPLLPKLLGSKFFQAKKQPLPVNITRKNLKTELERAVSSTYMPSIRGTTLSVRVGKISQTAAQVVANIKTALPVIASKINGGWDNVQSIGLKTSMSAYLPIWTCSLDDSKEGRWASLAADDEEESEFEGDEDEEDEDEDEEEEDEEEDGSATATTSKSTSESTSTPAEPVPAPAKKTKKSDAAAPEAASPTATSASTTKKTTEKKAKKDGSAEEGSTAYSLSNDDLKQKKSKAPGEKKKSKVVKSDSKGKKKWVIPGLF
ncbi:ribosomal protein L1p/L10e family-domain-containing protein [Lentinula raphanica]|nr:ribosomal protein L1p/L10e family-domain-containing protein [Lentinula raphanica]